MFRVEILLLLIPIYDDRLTMISELVLILVSAVLTLPSTAAIWLPRLEMLLSLAVTFPSIVDISNACVETYALVVDMLPVFAIAMPFTLSLRLLSLAILALTSIKSCENSDIVATWSILFVMTFI